MSENPQGRKTAVAIGGGTGVPKVLATGRGDVAQRILDWAKEKGMAIEKDADLAQLLANLDMGDSIPEEVYMAVAEILYYIYEVNDGIKES